MKSVFKLYQSLHSSTAQVKWPTKRSTCTTCFRTEALRRTNRSPPTMAISLRYLRSSLGLQALSFLNARIQLEVSTATMRLGRSRTTLSYFGKTSILKQFMGRPPAFRTNNGSTSTRKRPNGSSILWNLEKDSLNLPKSICGTDEIAGFSVHKKFWLKT